MNACRAVLLLLVTLSASAAPALPQSGEPYSVAAPVSAAADAVPYSDILIGDEEASIDLAADVPTVFGLFREAAARELGLSVFSGEDSPADTWLQEGELWFRAEPLDYRQGLWTRFRLRVSDFTLTEHEDRAEQLLARMGLLLEERLYPERFVDGQEPAAVEDAAAYDEALAAGVLPADVYQPVTGYLTPTYHYVDRPVYTTVYLPVWSVGWYGLCSPHWWHHWRRPGWGVWWWAPRYWSWSWHVNHGAFSVAAVDAYPWWWHGTPWTLWGHSAFGPCSCHWCTVTVVHKDKHHDHDGKDGGVSGDVADRRRGDEVPGDRADDGRRGRRGPRTADAGARLGRAGDDDVVSGRDPRPRGVAGTASRGEGGRSATSGRRDRGGDGFVSRETGALVAADPASGERDGRARDGTRARRDEAPRDAGPPARDAGAVAGQDGERESRGRSVEARRPVSQPVARRAAEVAPPRSAPGASPTLRAPVAPGEERGASAGRDTFSGAISVGPSRSTTRAVPPSASRAGSSSPSVTSPSSSGRSSSFVPSGTRSSPRTATPSAVPRGSAIAPSHASPSAFGPSSTGRSASPTMTPRGLPAVPGASSSPVSIGRGAAPSSRRGGVGAPPSSAAPPSAGASRGALPSRGATPRSGAGGRSGSGPRR